MGKNLEINVDIKFDKSKATSLESLINNINKNNKLSINFDNSNIATSLSSLLKTLEKIQRITNNTKFNTNDNNSNQSNQSTASLYSEINKLLREQYRIETQLITAEGEKRQTLQQNLATVKQSLTTKSINKEELLTQQQLNNLLNTELQLKRNLQTAQSANNDKINQELSNTKQLIELSQKQLTNQLNTIQSKNNSNINSSFLSQFQNSLKGNDIANRMEQIRQKINSLNGVNIKDVRSQVANLKSEIVELDQKVQMNGIQAGQRQFTSFGQTITNVASKFGIFLTAATVINKLIQEVKQGIEYVKYLDESFTDMAMTMEQLTKTQFNEMGDQLDEMAKKMGVTIEAVHDIGRIYSNEKTSVEEILAKTKPTAELSNIAGMNALTASKNMQDIANQFKLLEDEGSEASEVFTHIGDVMTSVSKNMTYDFASGIQELSSAISTAGSVAEMSGDGMERYTATIGSLIEQTGRSGSELANAYKMIASRVLQIKSVAEDAGVNDEDMSKAQKALNRLNIDIEQSTGDLKPLNEILQEVASKWGQMTDVEKQYTSEMLAGNRQRSIFVALMEGMTEQQELYNSALESNGALEQANEVKAKSIEGLMNTFKDETNVMWSKIISSDMIKDVISGMTTLVGTVSTAIDSFGSLTTVVGLLGTAIALVKGKAITEFIVSLYGCVQGESVLTVATVGLETAFNKLKLAIISNPIGAAMTALTALAGVMSYVKQKTEQAQEELYNFNQSFNEDYGSKIGNTSNAQDLLDNYKQLSSELKTLKSGTDEYKAKEEELKSIQEQLIEIYPEINELLDGNKNGKDQLINKTQELINKENELQTIQARKTLKENKIDDYSDFEEQVKQYKKMTQEMKLLEDADNKGEKTIKAQEWSQKGYYQGIANVKNRISDLSEEMAKSEEGIKAVANAFTILDSEGTIYENTTEKINSVLEQLGLVEKNTLKETNNFTEAENEADKTLENLQESATNAKKEVENLGKAFSEANDIISLMESALKEFNENGILSGDTVAKILDSGNTELIAALGDKNTFQEKLNNLLVQEKETRQENYLAAIEAANKEIEANQQVTNFNAEKYAQDVTNKKQAEQNKASITQNSANKQKQASTEVGNQNVAILKTDMQNLQNAIKSKSEMNQEYLNKSGGAFANYMNQQQNAYKQDYNNYEQMTEKKWELMKQYLEKDYSSRVSYYDKYVELQEAMNPEYTPGDIQREWELNPKLDKDPPKIDDIKYNDVKIDNSVGIGDVDKNNSSSKYDVDNLEDLYDRYLKINTAINILTGNLDILKEKQDNLVGSKYLKSLQEEINYYKDEQALIKQKIAEQSKERWDLRVKLDSAGFKFEDNDINSPILNYESQLKALTNAANAMADGDEKSAEAKKKAQERVKDLNEAIKDYNTLIGQTIPATQKEWEALNNSIKSVYETMSNLVADGESKMYDIYKYYADKRTNEIEEQENLVNSLYSKETEQEDLASKQSELAKIKEQMNLYELDNSTNGQAKLKELQEQYDELLKEMNTTIKDNQYEGVKQKMEDEKQAIEDSLKPENINKLINDGLVNGFIKIGNQTIQLNDAINDMTSNTTIGFQNMIKEANEYNNALKNAQATLKDIGISSINSNLGYDTSAMTKATTNNNYTNTYNINVEASGLDEQTVSKMILDEIKEYDKTWK